jgi:hypothetical protein
MVINGSCHCRNISFVLDWTPDPVEIPARACTCTFCSKHGGLWTSNPKGALRIVVADPQRVARYGFGTGTAQFHVCAKCGVVPVVTSEIDGRVYAVVNVNTFENLDPAMLRRTPASFDNEDEAGRLARRKRNWIGDVRYGEARSMAQRD